MQFTRETNRAFDLWLTRSLVAQYASALQEDVPERLLAIIREQPSRPRIAADTVLVHPAHGYAGSC